MGKSARVRLNSWLIRPSSDWPWQQQTRLLVIPHTLKHLCLLRDALTCVNEVIRVQGHLIKPCALPMIKQP